MSLNILIVEDDYDIQHLLSTALLSYGFNPISVSNGVDAINSFKSEQPDLVLLDVQLPDIHGFEVCKKIRTLTNVPIIFVSCLDDGSDIIEGLEIGGDDYVTKPFDLQELIARIRTNLRRGLYMNPFISSESHIPNEINFGPLMINFQSQRVTVKGEAILLSNKEYQILSILALHPEKIFSAHELYTVIWGTDSLGETTTLKVHISNLRKKLESYTGHSYIQTVRGFGYQFCL